MQFDRNLNTRRLSNYRIEQSELNRMDVEAYDWVNQLYLQTLLGNGFVFGLGVEHRKIQFDAEQIYSVSTIASYSEKNHFGSLYSYLKYDSFDNGFFPNKGVYFNTQFNLYALASNDENFKKFTTGKAELSFAIPILPRLNTRIGFEGGVLR